MLFGSVDIYFSSNIYSYYYFNWRL